ncbi:hypothetical protein V492_01593 [Pseudogymnoascus sp. VKM F-4246]|nr:hypothetical protein V492_01593 [Pseudogymnoascus sp. VKM F-4246]
MTSTSKECYDMHDVIADKLLGVWGIKLAVQTFRPGTRGQQPTTSLLEGQSSNTNGHERKLIHHSHFEKDAETGSG